jgi:hypothetical protein
MKTISPALFVATMLATPAMATDRATVLQMVASGNALQRGVDLCPQFNLQRHQGTVIAALIGARAYLGDAAFDAKVRESNAAINELIGMGAVSRFCDRAKSIDNDLTEQGVD